MRRFASEGGDVVNVQIEGARRSHREASDAGLLVRFTLGYGQHILLAIAMPSKLQPTIQFAMMVQQPASAISADHKCATGEVSGKRVAPKTLGAGIEQCDHLLPVTEFFGAI
jgi:hypothetical protein